jgi:FMN phosphatase YigB (HAD superfamily)
MVTMTRPPKAVVFDLGKVLLDFDYSRAARTLASGSRLDSEGIRLVLDQSPLLVEFETGSITPEEMHAEVVRRTGYPGNFSTFAAAFGDIFTEIPAMIELHAELRRRGVPTYIFSNTNGLAVEFIRRRFPFFNTFTGYVFSHEVKSMKPDFRIYEAVEALSGFRGADLVYLDDRADNIAAGAARGWQVIHHVAPATSVAQLRALGGE